MNPYPKPEKGSRKRKRERQKAGLKEYRLSQYKLAAERDSGLCMICWHKHNRRRKAQDVHHVFGRGREAGDWRECFKSLLCTCRECHPHPIKLKGASKNLGWVAELLDEINRKPFNRNFRGQCEHSEHKTDYVCTTSRSTRQLQVSC